MIALLSKKTPLLERMITPFNLVLFPESNSVVSIERRHKEPFVDIH